MEYNNYNGYTGYPQFDNNIDTNDNNFFNPSIQYEQAYMYYRYLSQQMEYKIKCKEFENMCKNNSK